MFLTTLLSFGLEQVVVRRIAVSRTSDWAAAAYFFHSLIGSIVVLIIVTGVRLFFKESPGLFFLPMFFLAQSIIFIGSPLKQFLNAKEKFTPYGVIALVSNVGKLVAVYLVYKNGALSVAGIAWVLICFASFELVCLLGYILSKPSFHFKFGFKLTAYRKLLKEAAPQYVSVIFDSGLSRLDWVLLGIISTNVITADYSFAYRAFEISRLPIAIIAPVILPHFSRLLVQGGSLTDAKKKLIGDFFSLEMFFAVFIVMSLNIIWTPAISFITNNKYGASNSLQFLILSLCIPFQFFINLLWTICFAGKKYRSISVITIVSAGSNLVLNLVLIPLCGGLGAAIAFLVTNFIQSAGFYLVVGKEFIALPVQKIFIFFLIAALVYCAASLVTQLVILKLTFSVGFYLLLGVLLRQITKAHFLSFRSLFKK